MMLSPSSKRTASVRVSSLVSAVVLGAVAGCATTDDLAMVPFAGVGGGGSGSCAAGMLSCAVGCVDGSSDATNCGACGVVCGAGSSCVAGACACQAGFSSCGGGCVDTQSSATHCGSCDVACAPGMVCSLGACQSGCTSGLTQCGSDCVDTTSNAAHCGACDVACGAGRTCVSSACACVAPQQDCGGRCVNVATDPEHCGACGNSCGAGTCVGGGCVAGTGGAATGGQGSGGTTGGAATGGEGAGGAATGGVATGGAPTGGAATGGVTTGGVATGGVTTGGVATGGVSTGGANTGGTGGDCTNVRPTGTDWDEATCDQWASQTEECSAAWMIDNGYCDESCGRCSGSGTGGAGTGGVATGGATTGGATTGGATTGGGGTGGGAVDCNAVMPTSGGQDHSATWAQGGSGNLAWQIWSNGSPGTITTYDVPAFSASWNNSGDFLGRMGFEWGNSGQAYTAYGTIKADYVFQKSGNAGQYSYLGIYGWSNNPCIEWYIVEDSFHTMPFNTGTAPSGTAEIDGGTYNLVHRTTSGTGGDRCGGAGSWNQYYSIRLQGKQCGTITVSDHFAAWAAKGWNLGNLLEVKIVVEAAGGQGRVDFPVANVTTSQ